LGYFATSFTQGSPFVMIPYVSTSAATTTTFTFAKITSTSGNQYVFQFGSINGQTYTGAFEYIAIGQWQ